jgi:hypothetical protein
MIERPDDDSELVRPRLGPPRHLSPGQLLAAYEQLAAQGDAAAKLRLETLRRDLAPPPPPADG